MRKFAYTFLFVFVVVGLATWLIWVVLDHPSTGIDDANIFFVYAKNLVNGQGFVYNAGGERVEGFSSLLWTLLCAAVLSFWDTPEFPLLVVNIVFISLGITVALAFVRSSFGSRNNQWYAGLALPIFFLVLLVTSPAYIIWNTIALMENAVWSTLLLLATVFVIQENISSRAINLVFLPISVLLLLTRPEAFLWVSVFAVILLIRKTLAHGVHQALKEMMPLFIAIMATVTALMIFRLTYFGYPLPNTYYAKVSPSISYNIIQGARYLLKYFTSSPIVSVSILAAILSGLHTFLLFIEKRSMADGLLFLPVVAGIGLLVPMSTGGDHFSSFRFYQGVYPILLLCLFYVVRSVLPHYIHISLNPVALQRTQQVFISSLALLLLTSLVLYQVRDWISSEETSEMDGEFEIAKEGRDEGQFIRDMFVTLSQLPSIGVVRAGGIKYTYPGEVIDLMGLNNLSMAHNGGSRLGEKNHAAFEKATFYLLHPDLVSEKIVSNKNWHYKAVDLQKSWDNTVPLKGLYDDTAFLELYVYAKVYRRGMVTDKSLVGWFQEDFLNELDASGDFMIERYEYLSAD